MSLRHRDDCETICFQPKIPNDARLFIISPEQRNLPVLAARVANYDLFCPAINKRRRRRRIGSGPEDRRHLASPGSDHFGGNSWAGGKNAAASAPPGDLEPPRQVRNADRLLPRRRNRGGAGGVFRKNAADLSCSTLNFWGDFVQGAPTTSTPSLEAARRCLMARWTAKLPPTTIVVGGIQPSIAEISNSKMVGFRPATATFSLDQIQKRILQSEKFPGAKVAYFGVRFQMSP